MFVCIDLPICFDLLSDVNLQLDRNLVAVVNLKCQNSGRSLEDGQNEKCARLTYKVSLQIYMGDIVVLGLQQIYHSLNANFCYKIFP